MRTIIFTLLTFFLAPYAVAHTTAADVKTEASQKKAATVHDTPSTNTNMKTLIDTADYRGILRALKAGFDVNTICCDGETPINYILSRKSKTTPSQIEILIPLLVKENTNISTPSSEGVIPVHYAIRRQYRLIFALFDPDNPSVVDADGYTPLAALMTLMNPTQVSPTDHALIAFMTEHGATSDLSPYADKALIQLVHHSLRDKILKSIASGQNRYRTRIAPYTKAIQDALSPFGTPFMQLAPIIQGYNGITNRVLPIIQKGIQHAVLTLEKNEQLSIEWDFKLLEETTQQ